MMFWMGVHAVGALYSWNWGKRIHVEMGVTVTDDTSSYNSIIFAWIVGCSVVLQVTLFEGLCIRIHSAARQEFDVFNSVYYIGLNVLLLHANVSMLNIESHLSLNLSQCLVLIEPGFEMNSRLFISIEYLSMCIMIWEPFCAKSSTAPNSLFIP